MLEVDGSGNQTGKNVYGTNLLMRTADGTSYYYMYNGHADVMALLDASKGTVVGTYYYDAFGNIQEHTGMDCNITYSGYQYDAQTGLYYLGAMYYDPKIAKFLSEDDPKYGNINESVAGEGGQYATWRQKATLFGSIGAISGAINAYGEGKGTAGIIQESAITGTVSIPLGFAGEYVGDQIGKVAQKVAPSVKSFLGNMFRGTTTQAKTASELAQSWQGSNPYIGIDKYRNITLKQ